MHVRFLILSIVAMSLRTATAQSCTDFVVLDQYSSSTDYKSYEKVKDAMCRNDVHDSSSARDAAVKAGIPIPIADDILSLNLQGSASASDWNHWSNTFCRSSYYETASQLKQSNLSAIFSENAKQVVQACLNREPVYAYFQVPPDGKSFSFSFKVQGREKLKRAQVSPSDAVKDCDPVNPFVLGWMDQYLTDLDISGQTKSFSCTWNSSKTVHVELKLAAQGDRNLTLPSIVMRQTPAPPPAPPPPAPTVALAETYRSDSLQSGSCGNFSGPYNLCTPNKPDGWVIVPGSIQFRLEGDRACGGYSTCSQTVSTPVQACYQFTMQGHSDECGHSGNTGIHNSLGALTVVWQHH